MPFHLAEPFLSVIGGGLAAAVVTCGFQFWSDKRRQKQTEDWQFRQQRARQIEVANSGIADVFFTAKANLYFMVCSLEVLNAKFLAFTSQADAIARQQLGAEPTAEALEKRKQDLLQSFRELNQEEVRLRLWQYEQESKVAQSKAEQHIAALQDLVPREIADQISSLYAKFSPRWEWNRLSAAQERLALYDSSVAEVGDIQRKLAKLVEVNLGKAAERELA